MAIIIIKLYLWGITELEIDQQKGNRCDEKRMDENRSRKDMQKILEHKPRASNYVSNGCPKGG